MDESLIVVQVLYLHVRPGSQFLCLLNQQALYFRRSKTILQLLCSIKDTKSVILPFSRIRLLAKEGFTSMRNPAQTRSVRRKKLGPLEASYLNHNETSPVQQIWYRTEI
jgi:hypothetical protein